MADQDVAEVKGTNGLVRPEQEEELIKLNGDITESEIESVTKRKPKKVSRQNSKENVATTFVNGPRSWKNSRRSRKGYGRGLPKKGGAGGETFRLYVMLRDGHGYVGKFTNNYKSEFTPFYRLYMTYDKSIFYKN